MRRIGSRGFGGIAISIGLPDDWFVKESFTLFAPDGQANVILSSEPLDPRLTREEYEAAQGALLQREFPHYRELSFEPFVLMGDAVGSLRVFEWIPPDGAAVTQAQIYYVWKGRGVTSTATTPSAGYTERRTTLLSVLRSIAVEHLTTGDTKTQD